MICFPSSPNFSLGSKSAVVLGGRDAEELEVRMRRYAQLLSPGLAGTPMPPVVCGLLTCRTAIPRLRPPRLKEQFAPLQQAAAPPRPPARALLPTRSSITMKLTQGSGNSHKMELTKRIGALKPLAGRGREVSEELGCVPPTSPLQPVKSSTQTNDAGESSA